MANLVLRHEANLSKIKQMWHLRMVCSKFAIEVNPFFRPVADASEKAYGAVVYMRAEYESRVECEIVASKTRVAPLDEQTIPRLAPLSNFTASRLQKSVRQGLENVVKVDDVVNWTDFMISLWCIRNTDKE